MKDASMRCACVYVHYVQQLVGSVAFDTRAIASYAGSLDGANKPFDLTTS